MDYDPSGYDPTGRRMVGAAGAQYDTAGSAGAPGGAAMAAWIQPTYAHQGGAYKGAAAAHAQANAEAQERARKNGGIVTPGRQVPYGPTLFPTDRLLLTVALFALVANALWLTLAGGADKLVQGSAEAAGTTLKRMSYISLAAVAFLVFAVRQCVFA